MTFRPGASLDPSQVEDVRGSRVGGRGVAIGGGGGAIGLIIVIAFVLLGGSPGDLGALSGQLIGDDGGVGPASTALANECRTGADANAREDCRIVGYINSIQAYWSDAFAPVGQPLPADADPLLHRSDLDRVRLRQRRLRAVLLSGRPVRLHRPRLLRRPADEVRGERWAAGRGVRPGPRVRPPRPGPGRRAEGGSGGSGANSRAVRTELQADCYAGRLGRQRGETGFLEPITDAQIADALDAAAAVGDDRIQAQVQGGVNPDSWTHGSAAQRQNWFSIGYDQARPAACDTFSGTP